MYAKVQAYHRFVLAWRDKFWFVQYVKFLQAMCSVVVGTGSA
jgi:hypothetical protein